MAEKWFFDKESLDMTPSRKAGLVADKELNYRQQSANFIQDMGQRLQVNQLCINTAIVYMHRFFMFHSFTQFNRNHVSTASIFLAAKVEEQPRKLEHVIKVAHFCLNRDNLPPIDVKSAAYLEQTSELAITENILLQTLGFDVAIDHPHTHVVKCCQLVRASKDLAQTSYFMATNSLHLTTMCLQYKPTVVACVCIHLTCKWSSWEIPRSKEGRDWFWYVDDSVTMDQLEKLTTEFLAIFDKSPSRLKKKILSLNQAGGGSSLSLSSFPTLNMDPHSPGTPQFSSSSSIAKRSSSSSSVKPNQTQINNKSTKLNLVNGGLGHHPSKSSSSQSHGPSTAPPNSSKHPPHYSSVHKGIPPTGFHHSAKDTAAHIQHEKPHEKPKPTGHHHSSSSSGLGPQPFPHGSSNSSSSNRPSSHSHLSGEHSQSHTSLSGQPPPPKPTSSSSSSFHSSSTSSSHGMVGQHPSKSQPPHTQPSKLPYNYNMKSQQPQQQQSLLLPPPPLQTAQGNGQISQSFGKSSSTLNISQPLLPLPQLPLLPLPLPQTSLLPQPQSTQFPHPQSSLLSQPQPTLLPPPSNKHPSQQFSTSFNNEVGNSPPKRPLTVEESRTGEEPPHKKSKKNKKEKHKHKDKDKDKKDKESSKKHKDKNSSGKDEKKHKREKHREKDKVKIQHQPDMPAGITSPSYEDISRSRIKFTLSTPPTTIVSGESSHEKSKHSSKKHSSKSKSSGSTTSSFINTTPPAPLKLKILPVRPPQ